MARNIGRDPIRLLGPVPAAFPGHASDAGSGERHQMALYGIQVWEGEERERECQGEVGGRKNGCKGERGKRRKRRWGGGCGGRVKKSVQSRKRTVEGGGKGGGEEGVEGFIWGGGRTKGKQEKLRS